MKDMLGRGNAIPVEMARELLLKSITHTLPDEVEKEIDDPMSLPSGMILSRDIFSPEDMPGFSRSTVDGFAVKSEDTFGATEGFPAYLNQIGEVVMGAEPAFKLDKGNAAKIATGGMIPDGADAVVMLEHIQEVNENLIEVLKPVAPSENVIQAGEDIKKGEIVLEKGSRLRPQDIGALAGLGITKVWLYKKPVVSIISTGDEIVHSGPLKLGQVRDINSYNLSGLITLNGGQPVRKGIFPDNYNEIKNAASSSIKESAMILITGGSSVGTKDMTVRVINDLGLPGVLFHGVSVKPGKPIIGGIVNGVPVFGLPGHPAAVTVCFELFIEPVLRALTGEKPCISQTIRKTVKARLTKNLASSTGREEHVRVRIEEIDGEMWAVPILGKSGLITTLVKADGTVVIPLKKQGIEKGEEVEVKLF
ncbi:MAG TPA: molybdopterin molybdenumtransferase MoeA [Nitrospiraceae bacterium]|nr:molybdopterin molybdenumtransferase MoeA [Nitrospiraceae bacterium]